MLYATKKTERSMACTRFDKELQKEFPDNSEWMAAVRDMYCISAFEIYKNEHRNNSQGVTSWVLVGEIRNVDNRAWQAVLVLWYGSERVDNVIANIYGSFGDAVRVLSEELHHIYHI